MADVLKYDEVITIPEKLKPLNEMLPQSVVFVFQDNTIPPIACNLDYLYAQTKQVVHYEAKNLNRAAETNIFPTNYLSDGTMSNTRNWSYKRFINDLIFKYGLKHEYYKNIHGKWIDMGTVRPHLALSNPSNGIFYSILAMQTINEISKETSIYTRLCDNMQFSSESWSKFRVKDINDIPRTEYIVKEDISNDGLVYHIKRGDGTYTLDDIPVNVYEEDGQVAKDVIHTKDDSYAKFRIKLGNYTNHNIASGNITDNDHHDYTDLYIQFYKADGETVFTDLDNMLIVCNNMIVDYKRSLQVDNAIFIPNAVKYAEIQRLTTHNDPRGYMKKEPSPLQLSTRKNSVSHILNFEIPNTEAGYFYKFDIRIYKWKNVSVSHFIDPLNYETTLKSTTMESNKMFWLKTGALFSKEIDKSKTMLLCGNEIIPSHEWEVDAINPRKINFLWMSRDFDIIYSEMHRKYSDYMREFGRLNDENRPKIEDYIESFGSEYEPDLTPAQRFNKYVEALNAYVEESKNTSALPFDIHYMPSVFDIVQKQFMYKQFAIVSVDTLDETNYTVELYENRDDIEVDKPYTNYITNKNWSPDDILVVNGLVHQFVNEYSDVFTPQTRWYLPKLDNVFAGADIYKLQVKRRNVKSNFYMKLNYTELLAGPRDELRYYTYNKAKNIYTLADVSGGFDSTYAKVDSSGKYDKKTAYFTVGVNGAFVRVPSTVTEFEEGVTYYTKIFNETYYVLK